MSRDPLLESGEVGRAADVAVHDYGGLGFSGDREGLILQAMPQYGFDAAERVSAEVERAGGCGLQTLAGMFAAEAHQAQTSPVAHFRMRFGGEDLPEQLAGMRPGRIGPTQ